MAEMQAIQIFVLIIVFLSMTGMGLELTLDDFRRLRQAPRAAMIGTVGQLVLLPLLGLAFGYFTRPPTAVLAGLIIISACPGGAASNMFSYLAGANVALSVSLTAISSVASIVTIPFWLGVGFYVLLEESARVVVPFDRVLGQLFVAVLIPIALGMMVRVRFPDFAARVRRHLRRTMAVSVTLVLGGLLYVQWETISAQIQTAGFLALALVMAALTLGWVWAKSTGLNDKDAFTVSVEVGMQNGALASLIVLSVLQRPEFILFPGGYVFVSFLPVGLWAARFKNAQEKRRRSPDRVLAASLRSDGSGNGN